ncbi:Scr1 family TA system antitoxin-like transcriptional regulator [Nonomuraea ferruginea]
MLLTGTGVTDARPPLSLTPRPAHWLSSAPSYANFEKNAGLSQEQLAEIIRFSPSLVGFIERAQRTPSKDLVQRCDEAVGAKGELLRLWPLISREASPRWFREWLDIEQEAQSLRTWQPLLIPGLLQTEDYARAMLRGEPGVTEEQVEKSVQARLERQIIWSRLNPPNVLGTAR